MTTMFFVGAQLPKIGFLRPVKQDFTSNNFCNNFIFDTSI